MSISKDLGTRLRAAMGISVVSDRLTVVVSEETGLVSVAENGSLRRFGDSEELKSVLSKLTQQKETGGNRFKIWKGRIRNERKNSK